MCFFGGQQATPEPTPIQQPAQMQDKTVTDSRNEAERRRRAQSGAQSTILTSGNSAGSSMPTTGKTLLGQ
jgi:hypothetical protein